MYAPTDLCACGHYCREHDELAGAFYCRGNTWAYPDDAERDIEGREVRCRCDGFTPDSDAKNEEEADA